MRTSRHARAARDRRATPRALTARSAPLHRRRGAPPARSSRCLGAPAACWSSTATPPRSATGGWWRISPPMSPPRTRDLVCGHYLRGSPSAAGAGRSSRGSPRGPLRRCERAEATRARLAPPLETVELRDRHGQHPSAGGARRRHVDPGAALAPGDAAAGRSGDRRSRRAYATPWRAWRATSRVRALTARRSRATALDPESLRRGAPRRAAAPRRQPHRAQPGAARSGAAARCAPRGSASARSPSAVGA